MREVKVYLTDELDKRFRKAAMDSYGYGRGSISKAAQEAFLEWCRSHEKTGPGGQVSTPQAEGSANENVANKDELPRHATPANADAPTGKVGSSTAG